MKRLSRGAWRHKIIKRYLHRTIEFQRRAQTKEELEAWREVETWFRSILRGQYLNENNVIVLPENV